MDRGPTSEDLIREAKTWAEPPAVELAPPPHANPRAEAPEALYPSDRIATRQPYLQPAAAPAPYPEPAAAPSTRSAGTGIRFALLIALAGLGLGAFFAYRAYTSSDQLNIFSVTPGTCFMDPSGATVSDVEVVDCTASHDLEAFALVTLPFPDGIALPVDDELFGSAYDQCLPSFEPYTGEPYDTSRWYLDAFVPDRRAWKAGDRGALCVLFLTDAEGSLLATTGSARA